MKKDILKLIILLALGGALLVAAFSLSDALKEINPPPSAPSEAINDVIEAPSSSLSLPAGFSIEVMADDVPDARVIVQDGLGNFWVSQPDEGQVSLLSTNDAGTEITNQSAIFTGLNNPHGLAIDPQDGLTLYIAESHRISRVRLYTEDSLRQIAKLPDGGRHFTRTIAFGPDNKLYVSIGSSCDTCVEEDERRAAIYSMERDGSDLRPVATGLRNAVFFDWSPVDGRMWATEMGRDHLGDNLPPDEINIIQEGAWYGWPWFYGKNVEDSQFRPGVTPGFAEEPVPSYIDLQAHVAPLGLTFVPEEGWPEEMWYDLLVAYHGSWNRSEPVGYKVARIRLDEHGNLESSISSETGFVQEEDFITGWLKDDGSVTGRPVDILVRPGGIMYLTDDHAGVIYRITYNGGS